MRAVRFDAYGGLEVLQVREVDDPVASEGKVVVAVRAAAVNPADAFIRSGAATAMFPVTFPSGQGTDLAGHVVAVGAGVSGFSIGDEVLGWTFERTAQAELVAVPAGQLTARPAALPWEVAGSLFTAPMTAFAAVRAIGPRPGETIGVSAAAGGVGSVAVQLLRRAGAKVIGIAGQDNHAWLRAYDVTPVAYDTGLRERLATAADGRLDAFIDTFGGGYVDLALDLGAPAERINTLADIEAVRRHGVKFEGGADVATAENLAMMAGLVADAAIEIPIAATYPLDKVQDAYAQLDTRHVHGKVVLLP